MKLINESLVFEAELMPPSLLTHVLAILSPITTMKFKNQKKKKQKPNDIFSFRATGNEATRANPQQDWLS